MVELPVAVTRLRRTLRRRRRLFAAGFASVAAVSVVQVLAPGAPRTVPLVVASHDLPSGVVLTAEDVRTVAVDPDLVPSDAAAGPDGAVGRMLAGPMSSGEPVTDRRVVGADLLQGYPVGDVAVPVRIQDADVVSLLHVGDRIDVYAATGDPRVPADRVATDRPVVALPGTGATRSDGALVVLAMPSADAARVAQAGSTTQLSVTLRGG
jgi:Flp pilus assembly protein CpaB